MMRYVRRQLIGVGALCCVCLSLYLILLDRRRLVKKVLPEETPRIINYTPDSGNLPENNNSGFTNASIITTQSVVNFTQTATEKKTEKDVEIEPPSVVNESCIPRYSLTKMKAHYNKFNENHPVFISPGFTSWDSRMMQYRPPFGLQEQESFVNQLLQSMTDSSLPAAITESNGCKRCIVVGSGGVLKNKHLGRTIDGYDVVFRINSGPVKGFESDVGNKTSIRIAYPEGAPRTNTGYDPEALFGMVAFKAKDLEWLDSVIHQKSPSTRGFWSKIAMGLPKRPEEVRLVNPLLVRETAFDLLGYPTNQGRMSKNVPTTGTIAMMMALRFCDEVHAAGFGYELNKPEAYLHYYESKQMKAIPSLFTHDLSKEKLFLRSLVEKGIVKDLTGGILAKR